MSERLSFEETRQELLESIVDQKEVRIRNIKFDNNDVYEFLKEFHKMKKESEKSDLRFKRVEKFLEYCKRLEEQATIEYYLKPKKQQYHTEKLEPYTTNLAA